ncbi:unnamed protein product [Rhizoctonia solani]|uniref:Transcription factor domain-containing protein n=1 Tax=Rhizoctonia solani TaxID=456999 RepID=A0A8H3GVT7_9AGAM|nr:unnamed protein product [Rhizoctonia solani]
MKGCWKCADRPPRADESRFLCNGCALNTGLGSTDLATFGSYRPDASTRISAPSSLLWTEQSPETCLYPSEEGDTSTINVGVVPCTSTPHQSVPNCYSAHPPPPFYWTPDNIFSGEPFDWSLCQASAPVDAYLVLEEQVNFSSAFGGVPLNPLDYQAISLEDNSSLFLDYPQQPFGLPTSPISQQGSHTRGKFEIPRTTHPSLQPDQHNVSRSAPGMSYGQNSLYQALLSLEYTSDESTTHSSITHDSGSSMVIQPWPNRGEIVEPVDMQDDPDGITAAVCGVLSLDSKVESNSLPFVLQSYANWMKKMMFDPLRSARRARAHIIQHYAQSTQLRFRMILAANILRAIVALDVDYKPMLAILNMEIRQTLIQSRQLSPATISGPDVLPFSQALHLTLELNIFSLTGPLHDALQVLSDIAPILRQICSRPTSQYIHLPALLTHPDSNVRGYPTIDVFYSMLTGLPTKLKYDATFRPKPNDGHTEALGTWLIGQPYELTIVLARIISLHDDFGVDVDPRVIEEIESDIRDFKPDPGTSADPSLIVIRLVVLEAWRQVGYINLYMRLCGESALGPRVRTAQRKLVGLVANTKSSHKMNLHVAPCLGIAGLAATRAGERSLVLERLQSLPHSRADSFLNRGIQMLQDIWMRTDSEGRPAQWSDLRIATRRIVASLRHRVSDPRLKLTRTFARGNSSVAGTSQQLPIPTASDSLAYTYTYGTDLYPANQETLPIIQNSYTSPNEGMAFDSAPPNLFSDEWSDAPFFGSSYARIEEIDDFAGVFMDQHVFYPRPSKQAPTPPRELLDLPDTTAIGNAITSSPQNSTHQTMTTGQASLFDALFSLARPGEDYYGSSDTTSRKPRNPEESLPTPEPEKGGKNRSSFMLDDEIDDAEDPEGIKAIMVRTLPLDRNVESNSLPFILESYAIWIGKMIFEPLRVAHVGREYVSRKYVLSETARLRLMLISHFARTVAGSTDYDINNLPSLVQFRDHMSQSYLIANSNRNTSRELDSRTAASAFDHSYELISISCKLLPLSGVLAIMQAGAPIFRRACPDPPEALVHLPSILLHIDVSLRYYATMDVLLSVITNRPMFFRYSVTFTPEVTESMMHIENHLGMQWLYGVPDRLVVTLARMNALREDFGLCVEERYIRELEAEIASFRVVLGRSGDPSFTVARMIVQECWRQAAYIYLYMGLGGANSDDARVQRVHKRFMQTFKESHPGRHPDLFLVFPMAILGISTRRPEDQELIRHRMPSASTTSFQPDRDSEAIAYGRNPLLQQNQTENKAHQAGTLNLSLSEEQRRFDFRQGDYPTAPKVWGGIDAMMTAVTGVVVVFFGGIAYVAWYKADVLDKIEEAFAPGYDPVLELMSYPSRNGEVDEDGKWNWRS